MLLYVVEVGYCWTYSLAVRTLSEYAWREISSFLSVHFVPDFRIFLNRLYMPGRQFLYLSDSQFELIWDEADLNHFNLYIVMLSLSNR